MKLREINTYLTVEDVEKILIDEGVSYIFHDYARDRDEHAAGLDQYITVQLGSKSFDIIPNMCAHNDDKAFIKDFIRANRFSVQKEFNVKETKKKLIEWVRKTVGNCTVVIGISGGKDSSVTAALCVKALGKDKVFGVLMPDGEQKDIDKSLELCNHLGIEYKIINIGRVTEAMSMSIITETLGSKTDRLSLAVKSYYEKYKPEKVFNDVYTTNTPARIRMTTLYGVAAILGNARVANTCNLSEDWVGYSTKYGDSAGDFSPLANLTVHEVKALGYELGLPKDLIEKVPSDGMSGKSDEEKLGFTYDELDTYIRTGKIDNLEHKEKIDKMHKANLHKLVLMPKYEPDDLEVKI